MDLPRETVQKIINIMKNEDWRNGGNSSRAASLSTGSSQMDDLPNELVVDFASLTVDDFLNRIDDMTRLH